MEKTLEELYRIRDELSIELSKYDDYIKKKEIISKVYINNLIKKIIGIKMSNVNLVQDGATYISFYYEFEKREFRVYIYSNKPRIKIHYIKNYQEKTIDNKIIRYSYPELHVIRKRYNIPENVDTLFAKVKKVTHLCYYTNYLINLPKAYTFLLSSQSLLRCRDISKIIAHKILFFLFVFSGFFTYKKIEKLNSKKKIMNEILDENATLIGRTKLYLAKRLEKIFFENGVRNITNLQIGGYCIIFSCTIDNTKQKINISSNGILIYNSVFINFRFIQQQIINAPNSTLVLELIYRLKNLCYYNNYLDNLPKAYTFLICNKKNNIFCRDISKIIAQKILFFPIKN